MTASWNVKYKVFSILLSPDPDKPEPNFCRNVQNFVIILMNEKNANL